MLDQGFPHGKIGVEAWEVESSIVTIFRTSGDGSVVKFIILIVDLYLGCEVEVVLCSATVLKKLIVMVDGGSCTVVFSNKFYQCFFFLQKVLHYTKKPMQ